MHTVASVPGLKTFDLLKTGRLFFAVALFIFGVDHFIFGEFLIGRAPSWPEGIPGKSVIAYVTGLFLIVTSVALLANRKAIVMLYTLAVIVLVWAVFRHLPLLIAANLKWGVEATNLGKALTLFGGLLAVAASMPEQTGTVNRRETFLIIGRICLAVFLILAGVQHFLFAQFVKTLVPAWIPGDLFWTYFAAVALIAGGVGLLITRTVQLAGALTGLMIFLWFVTLHIPRAISAGYDANEWTAVAESLCFSGIALVLAGSYNKMSARR